MIVSSVSRHWGVGLDDPQRSLPTQNILWFWETPVELWEQVNVLCLVQPGAEEQQQQRRAWSREPRRKDACRCPAPCKHTQRNAEPPTLTEMFIKIELQNKGLEHNVSWSRIFLNWFFFSMHKWKKKNQDYTKRTESAEHNKTVLMQQISFFNLQMENKLDSVETKNHTYIMPSTHSNIHLWHYFSLSLFPHKT